MHITDVRETRAFGHCLDIHAGSVAISRGKGGGVVETLMHSLQIVLALDRYQTLLQMMPP